MFRLRYIKVTNVTFKQKVTEPGYRPGPVSQSVHWSEVGEDRHDQTDILAAGSGQLAISPADKRSGWLSGETREQTYLPLTH